MSDAIVAVRWQFAFTICSITSSLVLTMGLGVRSIYRIWRSKLKGVYY